MTRIRGGTAQKLRTEFFEEGKRLDADPATRELANCWLCGGRVDYVAAPGSTDDSHHLDHLPPGVALSRAAARPRQPEAQPHEL